MNPQKKELKKLTLKALLQYSSAQYPNQPFLSMLNEDPLTYQDVANKVEQIQILLIELGIKRGDTIAMVSENMPNWGVVYLAVSTMGAIIVPILPDFHANEVHHIVRHCGAKILFVSEKQESKASSENMPELTCIIKLDNFELIEEFSSRFSQLYKKGEDIFTSLKSKVDKFRKVQTDERDIEEDDIAAIIYTSGTTGQSKGVVLRHKSLAFQTITAQSVVDISTRDRFLSILPMAHTLECSIGFLVPMLNGATIYYIDKPPTPNVLLKAFKIIKPTYMVTVPLIIEKIYKNKIQPNFQKSTLIRTLYKIPFVRKKLNALAGKKLYETFGGELRFFGIGGAVLSPFVEKFLQEANFPYAIGYGLTECAPLLAGVGPYKTRIGSTGPAFEGVELKILPSKNEGEDGEIIARGPNIMKEYFKEPEKTAEVLDKEGWFYTGDLGHFDKDGYLFISGRSKNVIIGAGGENIYPEQIESIIAQNELVVDSMVYEKEGKVVAKIHLDYDKLDEIYNIHKTESSQMSEHIKTLLEELRLECNTKVSSFSKVMEFIEQSEPFVKTPTKKIKRFLYNT